MKQTLGIAIIALLAGILIFNIAERDDQKSPQNEDSNIVNVTGDPDVKGEAIVPPGSTGIEKGKIAPDFELKTLTGETVKLSDFRGKKVFLNFWASWCNPCKIEMPEMQQFYEEHKEDVVILAVNTETNENKARKFVEKHDYTYPILLDTDMAVSDQYSVYSLPTTYFIGTDGKVQQPRKVGPMTTVFMEKMLQSLD